jgi:hypothetical protein
VTGSSVCPLECRPVSERQRERRGSKGNKESENVNTKRQNAEKNGEGKKELQRMIESKELGTNTEKKGEGNRTLYKYRNNKEERRKQGTRRG